MRKHRILTLGAILLFSCWIAYPAYGNGESMISEEYGKPEIFATNGLDLSVKGGYFHYQEPDADMSLKGLMSGVKGSYQREIRTITVKIRSEILSANVDYDGRLNTHQTLNGAVRQDSGRSDGLDYAASLWYTDSAVLVGKSFDRNKCRYTPFTGLGYRYLNNPENPDVASDYQREVTYVYLPLALEFQKEVSQTRSWGVSGELDLLLGGYTKARFSDASKSYNDLQFSQSLGGGVKISGFYNRNLFGMTVSVRPFIDVWLIDESDADALEYDGERVMVQSENGGLGDYCEPANMTVAGGVQLALRF